MSARGEVVGKEGASPANKGAPISDHQRPERPAGPTRPPGGPFGAARPSPSDRRQLDEHPVDLRRIATLFRPHVRTIILVVALISASSLINLAQPFLVRAVIDDALPNRDIPLLATLSIAMVVVAALTAAIDVVQTWRATAMGQRVMHTLRVRLFTTLQAQSLGFFTRTRGGEVQSRLTHDIAGMQSVVTSSATGIASNVTATVATAIAMVALSPTLSLISLVVLPPAIFLSRRVALMRREITSERQRELARLHTQVEEGLSISGMRLAKTLGTTERDAASFARRSEGLVGLELRSQLAGRWMMATMQIVFAAIPAVIYFAAGFPIGGEQLTIGTVVAFTALQGSVFRPLMGLMNIGVQWVTAMAFFSRIFEYLDLEPQIVPPSDPVAIEHDAVRGEVRIEGVEFAYEQRTGDGEPEPVLRNIDLVIPAGQTTALVGATGSGKSTLASLLPRLNEPTRGRVTIDGHDVRDIAPQDLARIVGVVSQETYLVHASVRDNLLLAAPDASDEELWEALEAARMDDTIRRLPEQLNTVVGARGHRFSGGEQQRLAIARTILRNPPVLVLDEATSALDNTTEAEVQAALDRLSEDRTTLTIAHRLSTIEAADEVIVLDAGRIVERGTAAQLREAGGVFASLAASRRMPEDVGTNLQW